jgi:chromosome segregation ATPase
VEFESHLGTWETAEADLRHSLDQLESRRSTVDVLRANVTQMFELAERTADDLRAAVAAQREIRESRAVLDDLLERLHGADEASAALDLHREEIDKAEARLARAQALLFDIQSSLETLNNQKAMLDHVIEQAGALTFQIQQAEVLIDRLRKERDITNAVRTSLEDAGVRAPRAKREA